MYWFGVDDGTTVVDGKAGCGGGAVGEEDDGDAEPCRVREQRRPPPERIRRESIQEDEEQGQRILGVIAAELDRVCRVGGVRRRVRAMRSASTARASSLSVPARRTAGSGARPGRSRSARSVERRISAAPGPARTSRPATTARATSPLLGPQMARPESSVISTVTGSPYRMPISRVPGWWRRSPSSKGPAGNSSFSGVSAGSCWTVAASSRWRSVGRGGSGLRSRPGRGGR